jgi:hypothetical protein
MIARMLDVPPQVRVIADGIVFDFLGRLTERKHQRFGAVWRGNPSRAGFFF